MDPSSCAGPARDDGASAACKGAGGTWVPYTNTLTNTASGLCMGKFRHWESSPHACMHCLAPMLCAMAFLVQGESHCGLSGL